MKTVGTDQRKAAWTAESHLPLSHRPTDFETLMAEARSPRAQGLVDQAQCAAQSAFNLLQVAEVTGFLANATDKEATNA